MSTTAADLAGLKQFMTAYLPAGAKVVFNNWPKDPQAKTLVIRTMPDDVQLIATGIVQTVRQYQVLYVDSRIDAVQAVTDAIKAQLAQSIDIPLDAATQLVGRVEGISGGTPFKTEQSTPLDGDWLTLRMTTYTAQSRATYDTIQGAHISGAFLN